MDALDRELEAKLRIDEKRQGLKKAIDGNFGGDKQPEDFLWESSNDIADKFMQHVPVDGIFALLRDLIHEQHIMLYEQLTKEEKC